MEESQGHEGKFVRGEGQVGQVKKYPALNLGSESSGQKLAPLTLASQKRAGRSLGHVSTTLRAKEGLGRAWQILVSLSSRHSGAAIGFLSLCLLHLWVLPPWWFRLFLHLPGRESWEKQEQDHCHSQPVDSAIPM